MVNLRDSTSNEKVKSYHSSYYRPDNLNLIITGQIEPKEVFRSLNEFEAKILSKVRCSLIRIMCSLIRTMHF